MLGTKPPTEGQSGPFSLVEGGLRPETRQTLENIATVLNGVIRQTAAEFGEELPADFNVWSTVAKVNVYLRDVGAATFGAMNEEYTKFISSLKNPPARMTSAGVGLALGAAVEIECVAQLPFHPHKGWKHKGGNGGWQRKADS